MNSRRVLGVSASAVFAEAAVAAGLNPAHTNADWLRQPQQTGTTSPPTDGAPAGGRASRPVPTGSADPTPSGASTTAPSPSASFRSAPTTGPGRTTVGIYLAAQTDNTGAVEVVEEVRLATPATRVAIFVPTLPNIAGLVGLRPKIADLQATADGRPVATPAGVAALTLPAPSKVVSLRYRLPNSSIRSQPAPPGRALVLLAPLTRTAFPELPVITKMSGSSVRNVVCPQLDVARRNCGSAVQGGWVSGPAPARLAITVTQLDLPTPGAP